MELPKRKNTRLPEFDYNTPGVYFITVCTYNKKKILSRIVGAIHESPVVQLTENGKIVDYYINNLEKRFGVGVDNYVIMPNHIHLMISVDERAIRESPLRERSIISKVIGYLKMNVSRDMHKKGYYGEIWQRSFYDHIIRNDMDYQSIWQYIYGNPSKWLEDCFYVEDFECI